MILEQKLKFKISYSFILINNHLSVVNARDWPEPGNVKRRCQKTIDCLSLVGFHLKDPQKARCQN